MLTIEEVPISRITVKERYREDLGDLTELSESIRQYGVLQPITINQHHRLVAGERRFQAAKLAGLSTVPCLVRHIPDKVDALEIELMENICRKEMLWHERARLEYAIFKLKKETDPSWSRKKQAVELSGVSKATVVRRIQIAEALEDLPDLKDLPTEEDAWKALNQLVEDETMKAAAVEFSAVAEQAAEHYMLSDDPLSELAKTADAVADFLDVDLAAFTGNFEALAQQLSRIAKIHTYAVVWGRLDAAQLLQAAGFAVEEPPAVWYKGARGTISRKNSLANCYEPFLVCKLGSPKPAMANRGNVFEYTASGSRSVALLTDILQTFAQPGSVVCSPFLGNGEILEACYCTNNTGFGWGSNDGRQRFLQRLSKRT